MLRRLTFVALAPFALLLPVLPVGVAGMSGCGPSFQAIYEGNARFEHCYALEENSGVPMPDKAYCWRDWSERYTYGQTRDRIHYATARYVALSQAPNTPTDEALMMAAPGETSRATTIAAPTPTNAFAPPPKVLEPDADQRVASTGRSGDASRVADASGTAATANPSLPASSCAEGCGGGYRECSGACQPDAGALRTKSCQGCLKAYRACMRDCFK